MPCPRTDYGSLYYLLNILIFIQNHITPFERHRLPYALIMIQISYPQVVSLKTQHALILLNQVRPIQIDGYDIGLLTGAIFFIETLSTGSRREKNHRAAHVTNSTNDGLDNQVTFDVNRHICCFDEHQRFGLACLAPVG